MSDDITFPMDLSREERAVILAMRHSQKGGAAIYRYALRYDDYTIIDPTADPWREDTPQFE